MNLEIKKYTATDYVRQRWKNGNGETTELVRDNHEPYTWRLSHARISQSSPFSQFPGYQRVIVTLTHQTIWLFHEGGHRRILPSFSPYTFSGDRETQAEIQEPVDDFNLIFRKEWATGNIYPTYFRSSREIQLPVTGNEHFVYCVDGQIDTLDPNTGSKVQLSKGELLRVSRQSKKEYLNIKMESLDPGTIALWVVIHLLRATT